MASIPTRSKSPPAIGGRPCRKAEKPARRRRKTLQEGRKACPSGRRACPPKGEGLDLQGVAESLDLQGVADVGGLLVGLTTGCPPYLQGRKKTLQENLPAVGGRPCRRVEKPVHRRRKTLREGRKNCRTRI